MTRQRAALYCRISEKDRKIDKVDIQHKRLLKEAADAGYEVAAVFMDDGISAYSGKTRPAFLALMNGIRRREFDVVMAVAPDRFARTVAENEALQIVCVQAGTIWHTLTAGLMNPSSAMTKAMASIAGVMAELESAQKIERLKARYDDHLSRGLPHWGPRPFGFENDRLSIRESEAALIRRAYDMLLREEATTYAIARMLNRSGALTTQGNEWTTMSIRMMMMRPRTAGLLRRNGVILDETNMPPLPNGEPWRSQLPAIVSREDWEAVTAFLMAPSRRTGGGQYPKHLSAGIARCANCGSPMRSAGSHFRGEYAVYYRCAQPHEGRGIGDGQKHTTIQSAVLDPLVVTAMAEAFLREAAAPLNRAESRTRASIELQLRHVRSAIKNVTELVGDGLLKLDAAKGKLGELNVQEEALLSELRNLVRGNATKAMNLDLRNALLTSGPVATGSTDEVRALLEERFSALPMRTQRDLVRQYLTITIAHGRGPHRITIGHLAQPHLP